MFWRGLTGFGVLTRRNHKAIRRDCWISLFQHRDEDIAFFLPVHTLMFLKFAQEFMVQTLRSIGYVSLGTRESGAGKLYGRELKWLMTHQERGYKKLVRFPNIVEREEDIRRDMESLDFASVVRPDP